MDKNKKMKKKIIKILMFIVYIIMGFGFGYLLGSLEIEGLLATMFASIVLLFLSIYITIIIHEGGHLIFGLLSGYKFVSFRIGQLNLIKNQDGYKLKRYGIAGTGGQCLLMPPEVDEGFNYPFILYNLGGGLLNLITAVAFLLLSFVVDNNIISVFLKILALVGLVLGLTNLIPMELAISNDGDNIRSLKKDENARRALWIQLALNAKLTNKARLRDIDEEWFYVPEGADLNNNLVNALIVNKASYYLDKGDIEKTKEQIDYILSGKIQIMDIFKYETLSTKMLLACMEEDHDLANSIYTKDLKKYIDQAKKYSPDKRVLLYAYNLLIKGNIEDAEVELSKLDKLAKSYPYEGESLSNLELVKKIDNIYKQ